MASKQRTFGQFETPADVADLLLAFCVRRADDRVLDPSCGNGALLQRSARWQAWLNADEEGPSENLWGVELDEDAAVAARQRLPRAHILHQNFFTLEPDTPFDAIVGNPPYTRAEWIDRLQEQAAKQLAMFDDDPPLDEERAKNPVIPPNLWQTIVNRRSGLHAYFLLHGARFLRDGGRFGFVLPNNWLDVGYGKGLKRFLLEQFKIIALIESTVERWFTNARVNTCLVILEKCENPEARRGHLVRFVQLRQPLAQLLSFDSDHRARFSAVETLLTRLLPAQDRTTESLRIRVVGQDSLRPTEKWGQLWRAPAVYRQVRRGAARRGLRPLKQWAGVQRGYTTGANGFFYMDQATIEKWQIEPRFRRPLLKSLRGVQSLTPGTGSDLEVLVIQPTDSLAGTNAGAYVAWGQSQGFHERSTCQSRDPWYALPHREPAALVLAKGIWERHFVPLLSNPVRVDQQLYDIRLHPGVPPPVAAALLNSSWLALQLELQGRVNFGEGVLWLAGYEVENLLLPDPRTLDAGVAGELTRRFETIAGRPLAPDLATELARSDRQALDDVVFDLLALSPTEATIIIETLLERVTARRQQSR